MRNDLRDDQIKDKLAHGDPAALEALWDRYADDLFALLLGLLCSRHSAEDVLQDVFVNVARKRQALAAARDLRAYLFQMARNEGISFLRKRSRTTPSTLEGDAWLISRDAAPSEDERGSGVADALAVLPEEQRTVIVLKHYRDKTFEEIGRLLGISLNTAASRYRYGMEKLRALLGKETP